MKDPSKLYELWKQAESYSCRPSDLLAISDDVQAFYLDRACWKYGSRLDGMINEAASKAKTDQSRASAVRGILTKALSMGKATGGKGTKKESSSFKDPALM